MIFSFKIILYFRATTAPWLEGSLDYILLGSQLLTLLSLAWHGSLGRPIQGPESTLPLHSLSWEWVRWVVLCRRPLSYQETINTRTQHQALSTLYTSPKHLLVITLVSGGTINSSEDQNWKLEYFKILHWTSFLNYAGQQFRCAPTHQVAQMNSSSGPTPHLP